MDVINDQKKEEKEEEVVDTKKSLRPKRREIKDDLMQERDGWSNQEGGWGNIKNMSSSFIFILHHPFGQLPSNLVIFERMDERDWHM